jgi:hypothetical protein
MATRSFTASVTGAVTTRADATSGTTNGSAVVTDAAAVAADVGKPVSGTGIPAGSFIVSVSAGVSFTMNQPATATGSVTVTVGYVPLDAGAGNTLGAFNIKVQSAAPDCSVALETSPDNTTYTQMALVSGSKWGFARSDCRQRYARIDA